MADITRRTFLAVTATLAVSATLMPSAEAAATQSAAPTVPQNKYKETIRLFDRCVASISDTRECNARMSVLLAYMRENFSAPPRRSSPECAALVAQTRVMLKNPLDIAGIRGIPPSVADSIYPIAIVALGLRSYNFPLDTALLRDEWNHFHDSYGHLIIDGLEK